MGAAAMAAACTALAGCGGGPAPGAPDQPVVVASTDVWGSIAQSVAGDDARVTSIVRGGADDPHSFEPTASDVAAVTDAAVVVYNGGGYDAWVDRALDGRTGTPAVDAYALLDAAALGEPSPANEHVFYDLTTAKAVAGRIAERLAEVDAENAARYRSRADEFGRGADDILRAERAVAAAHPGASVVATEPVAHYLLRAAGLADRTPAGFTAAVEQDTDPAPADLAAVLDLLNGREVAALIFNDQTATALTRQVRTAAADAGIPVVTVTETLPADTDYLGWQAAAVQRLSAALEQRR